MKKMKEDKSDWFPTVTDEEWKATKYAARWDYVSVSYADYETLAGTYKKILDEVKENAGGQQN